MGPCFVATAATPDAYSCCDSKGAPYTPPPLPPTPSPPSSPMVCDAKNNLQQTTFTGGKVVDFIMNNASAWTDCCAACSNATLQKLGCNYWEFQKNLKQHTPGVCTFTSTLGTFSPKGPYSKYGIAGGIRPFGPVPPAPPAPCSPDKAARCVNACAAAANTPVAMGGIHPRDKKPVGDRLGQAAYNLVYGGKGALTGPTLSGCSLTDSKLTITFNASLLSGDKVLVQKYGKGQSGRYGVRAAATLTSKQTQTTSAWRQPRTQTAIRSAQPGLAAPATRSTRRPRSWMEAGPPVLTLRLLQTAHPSQLTCHR